MPTEVATFDLKKTINLPKTKFAQKANLPQSEPARLKEWADTKLYERIQQARAGAKQFILHDGPPYANADIHLGTALNKILKDLIVKSRTMLGYDAPYVPGYDCHGLPIELHVERKLGEKKKDMPPLSIRRACREFAANALKRQTRDFQRLGILGEWDNPYITMSDHYEAERCNLAAPKVLARFRGSKLDRLEAQHPWIDRPSLFMLGEHVTLGGEADAETELDVSEAREKSATSKAGTGLVHTAPGHGHDDFVIGKRYGLEIYCPADNGGRFTTEVEQFAGLSVFEANPRIVEFMRARDVLLFSENYAHRYPHCWRCKNPVIFRATPQWFIAMDSLAEELTEKDEDDRDRSNFTSNFVGGEVIDSSSLRVMALHEVDERVKWIPAWGHDRMRNMLSGRPDWCVSRQRVWGVPIPAFYCSSCNEVIADPEVSRHVADIFEKESAHAWYKREARELLPENFKCQCGGSEFTKETDILDVWFDSGSSSIAVLEARDNLRSPGDVYIEGGDQVRGWSNSSL